MQGLLSSVGGIDANLFNKPSMAQMKKSQGTQVTLLLYYSASPYSITLSAPWLMLLIRAGTIRTHQYPATPAQLLVAQYSESLRLSCHSLSK